MLDGRRRGKRIRVDWARRGLNGRGPSRHRRLQNAKFGHGPVAEMAVHPLQDLAGAMLHLDGARTVHADNEHRAVIPAAPTLTRFAGVVPVPRPHHSVGHGELGEFGADDGGPFAKQRRRREASGAGRGIEYA